MSSFFMIDRRCPNYTTLKSREQKIYKFGDTKLNGGQGIPLTTLYIVVPLGALTLIIGAIVGSIINKSYIPWAENFGLFHTMFWLSLGPVIGLILYRCQFSGYRLYEYLLAYMRRKKVYSNDITRSEVKHTKVSVNTFIKHIL